MISGESSLRAARWAKVTDIVSDDSESEHDKSDGADDVGDDDLGMDNATSEEEGIGDDTDAAEGVEEAYHSTKAMGDADQQVCFKLLVQVHRK